jgi:hypothetical protein
MPRVPIPTDATDPIDATGAIPTGATDAIGATATGATGAVPNDANGAIPNDANPGSAIPSGGTVPIARLQRWSRFVFRQPPIHSPALPPMPG